MAEGKDRGLVKQVLEGLQLQGEFEQRDFVLPLWASINSNKFESLLNAIVANRLAKIKFPGASYVAGSPEGFKSIIGEEENKVSQSQIVYTDAWDGDSLKATYTADGKVKKAQVFVPFKFRVNGEMINLLDDEWSYVNEKGNRVIRQDKFDKELFWFNFFQNTSYRIVFTVSNRDSRLLALC